MADSDPKDRRARGAGDRVRVFGEKRERFGDIHHRFLRTPWRWALAVIVGFYLGLNACFAGLYWLIGGIEIVGRPWSYFEAFNFSIQTMGTIGYGAMSPTSIAANALVAVESVTGLLVSAVVTGLVFSKFSQSTARISFAERLAIGPMDGVPTLTFRIRNERANQIIEAHVRVAMVRTERTKEGMIFYRMHDLLLTRERTPALSRSWTAMHPITPQSPLYGQTPEALERDEVEVFVTVVGIDDTSLQSVHARHQYEASKIAWGVRYADILSEADDGALIVDLRRFHDLVPTEPIDGFPYPKGPVATSASTG